MSADGTRLFAWLFHHEGFAKQRAKAAILFYHGNGENLSSHYLSMIWSLRKGYDFLIFDYRGYGRSEGSPSPQGTVEDGEAALRWMKVHYPDIPIVIYAQSLGGAIALRNAIDLRAEVPVRAVVIDSSFASYQVVGRRILSKNFLTWPLQWLPWILLSDRFAPDGQIQKISPIPLLVMHAENDQTVPFRCGEELFEQAGNPKDFWRISGEGHVDAFLRFGDFYQNKLDLWFSQALARSPQ